MSVERRPFDVDAYVRRTRTGDCFICGIIEAKDRAGHHVIFEDDTALAFLNRYPTLYGYVLVAPRVHREQVVGDFTQAEYLRLQGVVYRVGAALQAELQPERLYVLSLGSRQGNMHVHWHIAPLPTGVPYDEQQLAALDLRRGVLELSVGEMDDLASRLRARLDSQRAPETPAP